MDFFGFFGKKTNKNKDAEKGKSGGTADIINNLRDQVDMLDKRNNAILKRIDAAVLTAKQKMEKKDKNGALIALKKKKLYEAEIEKNQGIQLVLENQIYSLEGATMQKNIVDALAMGNKSIKKLNTELSPEKIDALMDDIQEETDNFKAINEAMSQPLQQIYNDDELLEELDELEADRITEDMSSVGDLPNTIGDLPNTIGDLPDVPTTEIKPMSQEEEMEIEFNKLLEFASAS
jgi:charged multivesicular body protein 4A/B